MSAEVETPPIKVGDTVYAIEPFESTSRPRIQKREVVAVSASGAISTRYNNRRKAGARILPVYDSTRYARTYAEARATIIADRQRAVEQALVNVERTRAILRESEAFLPPEPPE